MILETLKSETAKLHADVEKENLARFIMDGSITQRQYDQLLRQNFKVYRAVEDFVNARYDVLPESLKAFAGYEKTNALAKDILNMSKSQLPQSLEVASPRDLATIVGALYVVEGSMIGGMMMARKIKECAHLSHIEEHYFFNSDVKRNSNRWKNFKDAVSSQSFSKEEIDSAVNSAKNIFLLFQESYEAPTI